MLALTLQCLNLYISSIILEPEVQEIYLSIFNKYFVIIYQYLSIFRSYYVNISTTLLFYYSTILLFYYSSILLFFFSTILLFYYSTILLFYYSTILLFDYSTIRLFDYSTIILFYYSASLLFYSSICNNTQQIQKIQKHYFSFRRRLILPGNLSPLHYQWSLTVKGKISFCDEIH